ncbi:MAG: element excision factor XisH family protein [Bacteroidota bacterium]
MRDKIHDAIRRAFEKAGWNVVKDPFNVTLKGATIGIDLAVEKVIEFAKEEERVLVEIKTLEKKSILYEFYSVYGQYSFYEYWISKKGINQPLYLAVSVEAYNRISKLRALKEWIEDQEINFVIVDVIKERIVKWIKY